MADSADANLLLKKRARRRLVGAVAFAGLAAVVLPMVMDEEPKQQIQDVQIRIPSQDPSPPATKPAKAPAAAAGSEKPAAPQAAEAVAAPAGKAPDKNSGKEADKPEKAAEIPAKAPETPAKATETPAKTAVSEPQRAAAILDGKSVTAVAAVPAAAANGGDGQYLILIGVFANPANVKQLQTKIGELGIKVYTEPLDSPQGKKTRVRAGPFPNREAADRALAKMKRIGVDGLVAAKQ
jgi:DedD protein